MNSPPCANRAVNSPFSEQSDSVNTPSGQRSGARAKTWGSSASGCKMQTVMNKYMRGQSGDLNKPSQARDRNVTAHGKSLRSGISYDSRR